MNTLFKRKQIKLFAKVTLFVFSFAWAICISHISPLTHPQTEHSVNSASEEQTTTNSTSCIDHTYQISRNQENPLSGDQDFSSIPVPSFTFNFSLENTHSSYLSPHSTELDTGSRLFLEYKVLRL